MPIKFFSDSDGLHVSQTFESPTVYFDHWAIRLFSDNEPLQERFANALKSKNGTLLLSNFSILEFAAVTDSIQGKDTELFIDRLLPNIYFTDSAPDKLEVREDSESNNIRKFWPPADLPTLKALAERDGKELGSISTQGFFSLPQKNREELLQAKNETVNSLRDALKTYRSDSTYVAKARNARLSNERTRTSIIVGELLRGFNLDPNSEFTDNDIIDFFHAIMPLNCCDYVLLDGAWEERVNKMKRRISKSSLNMPIAKCFSRRNNGLELFLCDLESFETERNSHEGAYP